jgi:4a-hydroxytetrahydrobiopterin dehydratase
MNLQENIKRVLKEMVIGANESKGWGESNQKLERIFKFKDFNGSIDFVNKVAKIAETQNHHPDIKINYNKVKVSITDHEKGGVSKKCHKLVKSIDDMGNEELTEYARTLKNARQQGVGLRFPKSAIKANPARFRPYNR